jgi:hypothetical protein
MESSLVSAHWCVAGNKPCGLINKLREPIRGLERVHEMSEEWATPLYAPFERFPFRNVIFVIFDTAETLKKCTFFRRYP